MSYLNYPSEKEYKLPRKNILVISCMDLRLTDNLVDFLNFDNMHNRYDHFILAGTSLLCSEKHKDHFIHGVRERYKHWKPALTDHIELAISLHGIKDIYIVEHQDCGAYTNFLKSEHTDFSTVQQEMDYHKKFAKELAAMDIIKKHKLNVHCFFIDLRGNVNLLFTKPFKKTTE